MIERFTLYWPYFRRFGWRGRAIAQTLFPSVLPPNGALGTIHLPRFESPLAFRYKTMDTSVFYQVFVEECYRVRLPFSPKTIVDAGAHAGYASIYFRHRYPGAEIVALEAEKSNFELLQKNAQPFEQIRLFEKALWHCDGFVSLMDPKATHSSYRFDEAPDRSDKVSAISPQSIMKQMNWSGIDLFKINIEGAEKALFSHEPLDWIPKVRAFVMDLHDRFLPGCEETVTRALARWNYRHEMHGDLHIFLRG